MVAEVRGVLIVASIVVVVAQQTPLVAVPSFAVVTSPETTRAFFGDGLPAAYDYQVPPIPSLVKHYIAAGQTLDFLDAAALDAATKQVSVPSMLEQHKLVVLPETAGLSDAGGAALLAFARGGGSVIVVGSALARRADGSSAPGGFATPLGRALGLRRSVNGSPAGAAAIASRNISQSANPEWWRLVSSSGSSDTQLSGVVGAGIFIHAVEPLKTGAGAMVLATATLSNGTVLPLLTATRVGHRGWLVYCATTADSQLVQQAVDFVFSATGVADPYAASPWSPMGVKVVGGVGDDDAGSGDGSGDGLPSTAVLSYAPPANTRLSLEGRFRVTLVAAVSNSTTCVSFLDRWWGDSPPSHTITNMSDPLDFTVDAQVSYTGAIACATISPNRSMAKSRQQPPWFELRTTANGPLHGFCKTPATQLAEECELNGRCSSSPRDSSGGDCICTPGWIGPTCGTLDIMPATRQGAWPHRRPNASGPESNSRLHEPVSWGFTVFRDSSTGKYHGFADTGCYNPDPHEQYSHMGGFQTTHVVADSALGPFVGEAIAAPPTHINPHAYRFDDGSATGLYVLYVQGGALRRESAQARNQLHNVSWIKSQDGTAGTCNGMEENHTQHPLPFVLPSGNCTTTLCAIYTTSPHGPWKVRSVDSTCSSNAVPYQLKNGSVLLAGTCGSSSRSPLPGADGEQIQLLIADPGNFFGPFKAVAGQFGGTLWMEDEPGEDPTLFEDSEGNIHMLFHGYQWHGLWTGMHAYSSDGGNVFGVSQRRDGRGAFSTNQTYEDGGWETFYRRERPELRLDSDGHPSLFYSGVQYAQDRPHKQYSYSTANRVRGGNGGMKTDDNIISKPF